MTTLPNIPDAAVEAAQTAIRRVEWSGGIYADEAHKFACAALESALPHLRRSRKIRNIDIRLLDTGSVILDGNGLPWMAGEFGWIGLNGLPVEDDEIEGKEITVLHEPA